MDLILLDLDFTVRSGFHTIGQNVGHYQQLKQYLISVKHKTNTFHFGNMCIQLTHENVFYSRLFHDGNSFS